MSRILVELAVILLLIALNGLFAMSELAVVSARKGRLRRRAERGDRGARAALELAEDPNRFLATVQVGITFIGILAGGFGGATIAEELADRMERVPAMAPYAEAIALALVVLAVAYLSLIFGELVPKRLALARPEAIAARAAGPLRQLARLGVPAIRFLGLSTDAVLRSLGVRAAEGPAVTEEDIRSMVKEDVRAGAITPAQDAMVRRVFALDERPVGTLATRRAEVAWIDAADPPEAIRTKIAASPHARFPVCEGEIDRILGVVEAKDLLLRGLAGRPLDIHGLLKLSLFVYEGVPASRVLELFRTSPVHVAVVLDEYGSVEPSGDRLEAQPRLILGPQLDALLGMPSTQLGEAGGQGVFSTPAERRAWQPPDGWAAAPGARSPAPAAIPSRSSGGPPRPSGRERRRRPSGHSRARRRAGRAAGRPTGRSAGRS